MTGAVDEALRVVYREQSRRVLATLIRLLGDFDSAEEALHEAFVAAAERWPREGVPQNPYSWLVSAGRFKLIDRFRKREREANAAPTLIALQESSVEPLMGDSIADDELRLIFTCCHPRLAPDARIALTLREVCRLTTEEVARAFMVSPPTIAQRIVRAKSKIREEQIPYEVPEPRELAPRLESVLEVVYLVFNEGYAASSGEALAREALSREALRLGRLLVELAPEAEVRGLLALMLLHESRRASRSDAEGDLVLLEDQDRSHWDQTLIRKADELIRSAFAVGPLGRYSLQAAIAGVHAHAASFKETDWTEVVALYDLLLRADPSTVVALNRAVALGMRDGPAAGLAELDRVMASAQLDEYHYAHAARGDFQRRLGLEADARASYERALGLTSQAAERRFLQRRLKQLER